MHVLLLLMIGMEFWSVSSDDSKLSHTELLRVAQGTAVGIVIHLMPHIHTWECVREGKVILDMALTIVDSKWKVQLRKSMSDDATHTIMQS